jgi:hypothetical protein
MQIIIEIKINQMKRTTSTEEEINKIDEANPHRGSTSLLKKEKH